MTLRKAVKLAKRELESDEICVIRQKKKEIQCYSRPMADTLARLVGGRWEKTNRSYTVSAS